MIRRLLRLLTDGGLPDYSGAFDENGDMLPHADMIGPCPICSMIFTTRVVVHNEPKAF